VFSELLGLVRKIFCLGIQKSIMSGDKVDTELYNDTFVMSIGPLLTRLKGENDHFIQYLYLSAATDDTHETLHTGAL
jgi:hypothetical protein